MSLSLYAQLLGKKGGAKTSEAKKESSKRNGLLGGRPIMPVLNDDGISIKGCNFICTIAEFLETVYDCRS